MDNKEKKQIINDMYYTGKMSLPEIAKKLGVTKQYVSLVLKEDIDKYSAEKQERKVKNKIKHTIATKEYVYKSRKYDKEDQIIMSQLAILQQQNSVSMSKRSKLSNIDIVAMNLQHYSYTNNKEHLIYDKKCGSKPNDLPGKISVHLYG